MAQRSVPAPFLTKTYYLVDDSMTNDVVSWNEDGTAFVVWKTAEFAKDLLPKYFKHDNFSSFVRQLNTYGFRKTVSDKWEFANDYFKRGQKQLLAQIRRRRTAAAQIPATTKPQPVKTSTSPANSGEYLSSSSSTTSSPNYKNPNSYGSTHHLELLIENENLKKENQFLRSELARTREQCEQLIALLNHKIERVMNFGGDNGESSANSESGGEENENCTKLFGVVLRKKRGFCENRDFVEPRRKEMRVLASPGESSEVCD